jgi:hypothetical protein
MVFKEGLKQKSPRLGFPGRGFYEKRWGDHRLFLFDFVQAASQAKNRRANRTARCRAYHCRFTRLIEWRRLRVPSGMAVSPGTVFSVFVLLSLPAQTGPIRYGLLRRKPSRIDSAACGSRPH